MKVYVITEGDYSDYRIVGVTTDKEKAEKYCEITQEQWYVPRIEKYETDVIDAMGTDGRVFEVHLSENGLADITEEKRDSYGIEDAMRERVMHVKGQGYYVTVMAVDEEHALKIGSDCIAEYKYKEQEDVG